MPRKSKDAIDLAKLLEEIAEMEKGIWVYEDTRDDAPVSSKKMRKMLRKMLDKYDYAGRVKHPKPVYVRLK